MLVTFKINLTTISALSRHFVYRPCYEQSLHLLFMARRCFESPSILMQAE